MDEDRHKILVALVFAMIMHQVIAQVVTLQQVVIEQHWSMVRAMQYNIGASTLHFLPHFPIHLHFVDLKKLKLHSF
jgi:hypothetical protein